MANKRWCVIAASANAEIYEVDADQHFHIVERLINDAYSPGPASSGRGMHHENDRKNSKPERLAKDFAKRIANTLEQAHRQGEFESLVLAADPHFLGLLREAIRPVVKQCIQHEIPRRYQQGSASQLEKQLSHALT